MITNYDVARELASILEYWQEDYLITEDDRILCFPQIWNDLIFKISIASGKNINEKKRIIYTKRLLKLIEKHIPEGYKLLKLHDYRYLYDNTTEQYVPPIMKVMSTPLTITIIQDRG